MSDQKRIEWIDLAKGICMFLVIFGHFPQLYQEQWAENLTHVMAYFRMPLYFLLSGLFFKTYSSPKAFLYKKINHLLIPYTFFYIIGRIIPSSEFYQDWFLFCLFLVNVIGYLMFSLVRKYIPQQVRSYILSHDILFLTIFGVFAFVLGYGGNACHLENLHYPLKIISQHARFIGSAFVALPFFLLWLLLA